MTSAEGFLRKVEGVAGKICLRRIPFSLLIGPLLSVFDLLTAYPLKNVR